MKARFNEFNCSGTQVLGVTSRDEWAGRGALMEVIFSFTCQRTNFRDVVCGMQAIRVFFKSCFFRRDTPTSTRFSSHTRQQLYNEASGLERAQILARRKREAGEPQRTQALRSSQGLNFYLDLYEAAQKTTKDYPVCTMEYIYDRRRSCTHETKLSVVDFVGSDE